MYNKEIAFNVDWQHVQVFWTVVNLLQNKLKVHSRQYEFKAAVKAWTVSTA